MGTTNPTFDELVNLDELEKEYKADLYTRGWYDDRYDDRKIKSSFVIIAAIRVTL